MVKQEEVVGCTVWRMNQRDNFHGFGLGCFLLHPSGIVTWHIIETHIDVSKTLSASAFTQIPFKVRKNRCTSKLCIVPHSSRQYKKIVNAVHRPNKGSEAFNI
jgi:hypothetical protein